MENMASIPKPLDYAAYLKTPWTLRRYDIVDAFYEAGQMLRSRVLPRLRLPVGKAFPS